MACVKVYVKEVACVKELYVKEVACVEVYIREVASVKGVYVEEEACVKVKEMAHVAMAGRY